MTIVEWIKEKYFVHDKSIKASAFSHLFDFVGSLLQNENLIQIRMAPMISLIQIKLAIQSA